MTYKLVDVGLARVADADGRLARDYGGALQFRAPEVCTGEGAVCCSVYTYQVLTLPCTARSTCMWICTCHFDDIAIRNILTFFNYQSLFFFFLKAKTANVFFLL